MTARELVLVDLSCGGISTHHGHSRRMIGLAQVGTMEKCAGRGESGLKEEVVVRLSKTIHGQC